VPEGVFAERAQFNAITKTARRPHWSCAIECDH